MRTIPCPFDVKVSLNADGSYDLNTTYEQFQAMLEDANEDRTTGAETIRTKVVEMYDQTPADERGTKFLPKGAVATSVLTAIGANASNWQQKSKLVNEVLSTLLIGSVAGARLCTPAEAQENREKRAAKRALKKAEKAAAAKAAS